MCPVRTIRALRASEWMSLSACAAAIGTPAKVSRRHIGARPVLFRTTVPAPPAPHSPPRSVLRCRSNRLPGGRKGWRRVLATMPPRPRNISLRLPCVVAHYAQDHAVFLRSGLPIIHLTANVSVTSRMPGAYGSGSESHEIQDPAFPCKGNPVPGFHVVRAEMLLEFRRNRGDFIHRIPEGFGAFGTG